MANTLIIIDAGLDMLWRNRLNPFGLTNEESSGHSLMIFDLDQADSRRRFPYWLDLMGWRKLFRSQQIREVQFFSLSPKVLPLLLAASANRLPLYLHLTGPVEPAHRRILKTIARRATRVICPADYIQRQANQLGIDNTQVQIPTPAVKMNPQNVSITRQRLGQYLSKAPHAPLLLAIESPDNYHSLKTSAWAAAMIYHVHRETTLVVAGRCDDTATKRLLHLETVWNCPNLFHFAGPDASWDELMDACDLLIGGNGSPLESIRLTHATSHTIPIVMPDGPAREFLRGRENTSLIHSSQPRQLATAALKCLDNTFCHV